MILRRWTKNDNDEIEVIENNSFKSPWSRRLLDNLFSVATFFGLVAEEDGKVVGYVGVNVNVFDADILNVAVTDGYRRRGIAESLLVETISVLKDLKTEKVFLEVRRTNVAAQNLYYKVGFVKVGERAKYYENTEDALILCLELGEYKN